MIEVSKVMAAELRKRNVMKKISKNRAVVRFVEALCNKPESQVSILDKITVFQEN
jgi:hypothetical protein